jgi:hypothetical protein
MDAISKINLPELAPQSSDESKISLLSRESLPEGTASALLLMLGQAQARYPNQILPELTQEMYLSEWEAMTVKYGLAVFRDALLKAIQAAEFFPDPKVVRDYCKDIAEGNRSAVEAQKVIAAHDAMRDQWLREREERKANANPTRNGTRSLPNHA